MINILCVSRPIRFIQRLGLQAHKSNDKITLYEIPTNSLEPTSCESRVKFLPLAMPQYQLSHCWARLEWNLCLPLVASCSSNCRARFLPQFHLSDRWAKVEWDFCSNLLQIPQRSSFTNPSILPVIIYRLPSYGMA